jgi:hypothetical protein
MTSINLDSLDFILHFLDQFLSAREAKHVKESEHWLNQTSTSNRYTALLEEESEDQ